MANLQIIKYPDPLLHETAHEVKSFDAALAKLIDDMIDTMQSAVGIGLAAPQVGVLSRVAVVDVGEIGKRGMAEGLPERFLELVNPVVSSPEGNTPSEEGCLSIPDYRDTIKRSALITVSGQDRHGKSYEFKADGLLSICIQHEVDHLNGVLFIDHLSRLKREYFKRWYSRRMSEPGLD